MKQHNLKSTDFIVDEIESIELIGDLDTIDITVEDTHMFFVNDIYSHNSSADSDIVTGDQIASSFAKIMVADFIISLSRKVTDKIAGTGRFFIIKNRFGPDGITLPSRINMGNGRMDIFEEQSVQGKETKKDMDSGETLLRKSLAQKYKEIQSDSLG